MHDAFAKPSEKIAFVSCGPDDKHSFFFDLIETDWKGNKPLHRLCSLMRKMKARAYTLEVLEPNAEIRDETVAATVRCDGIVTTTAKRITFFRSYPASTDWHDIDPNGVLAYAVLLRQDLPHPPSRFFILESVVIPPALFVEGTAHSVSNYYPHCTRRFQTTLGYRDDHRDLELEGSFFCQQNDLTHVCAHACLRMAVNSSPTLALPQKLTNARINDLLGIDHRKDPATQVTRRVGHYNGDKCGGLTDPKIVEVIKKLGRGCHFVDFVDRPGIEYATFIYPLVESRLPVILGIDAPGVSHVVTILGHTLNTDRWEPEAKLGYGSFPVTKYTSSAAWADHFLMSDDNFGMYVTLPSDMIRNFLVPDYNPNLHASSAIALVPAGVSSISGILVEAYAASAAETIVAKTTPTATNRWLAYLREPLSKGATRPRTVVCRTLMVTDKARYICQLGSGDSDGNVLPDDLKQRLESHLPDSFWLTEVTVPDLYTANKHKLGDVITKSDATPDEFVKGDGRIFCWLPGLARWGAGLPDPQEQWPLMAHVPLLRHADDSPPSLEW